MSEDKKLRPTVIPMGGVRKQKVAPVQLSSPKARGPTVIPGVERRRIEVTRSDLRKLSPQATEDVLVRALHLLEAVVVEKLTDRKAILWGHDLQQGYSGLVSETLSLSQDDVLTKVAGYLNRMMDILSAIDLHAICNIEAAGVITQYFRRGSAKIDTPEEFESARAELEHLLSLMSAGLDQLLARKEKLESHSSRIDEFGEEVEASALAAQFLSTYLQSTQAGLSQRFTERSMSLTATLAQIRGSSSIRGVQIEQPLGLISAIQNVALVMLPGWIGSVAALTVLGRGKRKPTPTEARELVYQLGAILDQLKGPTR